MKKWIFLLLLILILNCGCVNNHLSNENKSSYVPEQTKDTASNNIEKEYIVGESYQFRGITCCYDMPNISHESRLLFSRGPNDTAIIEEIRGDYAKIFSSSERGWTLLWYLSKDSNKIRDIYTEPYEMVTNRKCYYYLYPNENDSIKFALESGRVVHIMGEFDDWYCVEIIDYGNLYYGDKWVKKSCLTDIKEKNISEGKVSPGAQIYTTDGKIFKKNIDTVIVIGEINNMYKIKSYGEWTGLIRKEDFLPNPYESFRKVLKADCLKRWSKASKIELVGIAVPNDLRGIIEQDRIKDFIGMLEKGKIGPEPLSDPPGTCDTVCEMIIHLPEGEESVFLGHSFIMFNTNWFQDRYLRNQNCIITNNYNLSKDILALCKR